MVSNVMHEDSYILKRIRRYNEETKFSENFVSSLYLLIQSSTLKKCIEHCLTALATLLHVYLRGYILKEELQELCGQKSILNGGLFFAE